MKTNYWFVRHGESEANISGILNGDYTSDLCINLTSKGYEQADFVGRELSGVRFDKVYSSNFIRTVETAKRITDNQAITIDNRLTERICHQLDGKNYREFYRQFGDLLNPVKPGTESLYNIMSRVSDFIQETRTFGYDNILCVTHGDVLRAARIIFTMCSPIEELRRKTPKNCEILKYQIPDTLRCLY